MLKMPDITTLPGGRKVRTDLRPYADEVASVTDEQTEEEETPSAPGKTDEEEAVTEVEEEASEGDDE